MVQAPESQHRLRIPELHGSLVDLRGLFRRLREAVPALGIRSPKMVNGFRDLVLHVPTDPCQLLRIASWGRQTTKRTGLLSPNLAHARGANLSAAAALKRQSLTSIHVPVLVADRTARPEPRHKRPTREHRLRFRLRIRLAPRASRLVFRCDASAGLVGARPRRGAVEDLLRGRRRGRRRRRPRRLRRALVSDLLTRRAVSAVAPVDLLTGDCTVLRGPTGAVQLRLLTTNGACEPESQRFRPRLLHFVFPLFLFPVLCPRRQGVHAVHVARVYRPRCAEFRSFVACRSCRPRVVGSKLSSPLRDLFVIAEVQCKAIQSQLYTNPRGR